MHIKSFEPSLTVLITLGRLQGVQTGGRLEFIPQAAMPIHMLRPVSRVTTYINPGIITQEVEIYLRSKKLPKYQITREPGDRVQY